MALNLMDVRTRLMAFDPLRDKAGDDYLLVRDIWSQRRNSRSKATRKAKMRCLTTSRNESSRNSIGGLARAETAGSLRSSDGVVAR